MKSRVIRAGVPSLRAVAGQQAGFRGELSRCRLTTNIRPFRRLPEPVVVGCAAADVVSLRQSTFCRVADTVFP